MSKALLNYVQEANRGVKGKIIDAVTKKPIANATLQIEGRDMNFYSSKDGEFWRILLYGIYDLKVNRYIKYLVNLLEYFNNKKI